MGMVVERVRRSVRTGLGGPALLAMVLALVLGTGACQEQAVPKNHKTVRSSPALPAKGPEAGTFERVWRTPSVEGGEPQLVEGRLLLPLEDGVQAYDGRTGKPTWHYRESFRELHGMASTGGVLVLVISGRLGESDADAERVVGLDLATGKILWEKAESWDIEGSSMDDELVSVNEPDRIDDASAAGGTVVMQVGEDERLGIEARTGEVRWEVSRPDLTDHRCLSPEQGRGQSSGDRASDRPLVHVGVYCPRDRDTTSYDSEDPPRPGVLAALDARTGELRWAKPLKNNGQLVVRDGIALYQEDPFESTQLLDRDGREIMSMPSECDSSCQLQVAGNSAAVTAPGVTEGVGTVVVDTRRPVKDDPSLPRYADGDWSADSIGSFYRIQRLRLPHSDPAYLPQALGVLDGTAARWSRSSSGGAERQAAIPSMGRSERLIGAAGDRFYTTSRDTGDQAAPFRIYAYARTGSADPIELGGVHPREWPDACKLLAGLPGNGRVRPGKPLEVAGHRIPRQSCSGRMYTVKVVWVARNEREADGLVTGSRPEIKGVDEADDVPSGLRPDTEFADWAVMRSGRVILQVGSDGEYIEDLDRALSTVAANLRSSS